MKGINITEKAHNEIKKLFARNNVSILHTDPELTELYDNFVFDKLLDHLKELSDRERVVVQLVSTIGSKAMAQFERFVNAALNVGVKPREIREVVYSGIPFVGWSKMLDFVLKMNEVFENNDIKLPLDPQNTTTEENREAKGREMMEQAFGKEMSDAMFASVPASETHLYKIIANFCFGGFFTRNGLTLAQRELNAFVLLAAMGDTAPQMRNHAIANKNNGNSKAKMVAAITAVIPYIGFPRAMNAITVINSIYEE
jgi:4-carboxymuconolactone decarboxylase